MTSSTGPLYELTFSVEHDLAGPLERWLAELAERAALDPGIVDARLFKSRAGDADEPAAWTLQLQSCDDSAYDVLQDGLFAETDAALAREFEGAVAVTSRTLREDDLNDVPPVESPDCLNCGTRLRGQYCGICGQRARSRLISLWQLISEAFGDLLELDSRLWRTVVPLLRRPGMLTRDYLEGRRARYMPPFRSYLVLSLVFFVVAFFNPREQLGLLFEPVPEPTAEELAEQAEQARAAATASQEILSELAAEGIIAGDGLPGAEIGAPDGASKNEVTAGLQVELDDEGTSCQFDDDEFDSMPPWFQRRFTPARLKSVCERVTGDNGKAFLGLLRDNIPMALIVLMPLMALVLKVLYPLSRRYFVEHLLFIIHYHAFFFLILTLQVLFARFSAWVRLPDWISPLAIVAVSLYIPVYLYMAMRHVYGQGRTATFIKYVALVVAYGLGATFTMLSAAFFALAAV